MLLIAFVMLLAVIVYCMGQFWWGQLKIFEMD